MLVTGGAGYVGSHCAVKLLEAGHRVAVLDNLSNAAAGAIITLTPGRPRTVPGCRGGGHD